MFTKTGGALSVGLFSQTYLELVHAEEVIVPLVPFSQQNSILPGRVAELLLSSKGARGGSSTAMVFGGMGVTVTVLYLENPCSRPCC